MKISIQNAEDGNKAMASALLLYYHLLDEGGITHAQTVYNSPNDFNGFSFLDVDVEEALEIDEAFLREAAVIFLLCELNDTILEFENDFWLKPSFKKIISSLENRPVSLIPETTLLLENVGKHESIDYAQHNDTLKRIYTKYVVGRFKQLTLRG